VNRPPTTGEPGRLKAMVLPPAVSYSPQCSAHVLATDTQAAGPRAHVTAAAVLRSRAADVTQSAAAASIKFAAVAFAQPSPHVYFQFASGATSYSVTSSAAYSREADVNRSAPPYPDPRTAAAAVAVSPGVVPVSRDGAGSLEGGGSPQAGETYGADDRSRNEAGEANEMDEAHDEDIVDGVDG
jgi:hypothetical protein